MSRHTYWYKSPSDPPRSISEDLDRAKLGIIVAVPQLHPGEIILPTLGFIRVSSHELIQYKLIPHQRDTEARAAWFKQNADRLEQLMESAR